MTRMRDAQVLLFEPPGKYCRQPGRRVRPGAHGLRPPPCWRRRSSTAYCSAFTTANWVSLSAARWSTTVFRSRCCGAPRRSTSTCWTRCPTGCGIRLRPGLARPVPRVGEQSGLAADVVFAASRGSVDHLSPCNDNIALLPNGVNHPMFTRPPRRASRPELRELSSPILGYTGTLWRESGPRPRSVRRPGHAGLHLRLSGPPGEEPHGRAARAAAQRPPPGAAGTVEVPDYLARFDVCLNLLRRSEQGNDVVPCRIYEYLSSGKPVVSMLFPEQVEHFPDVVYARPLSGGIGRSLPPRPGGDRRLRPKTAGGSMGPPPPGRPAPTR